METGTQLFKKSSFSLIEGLQELHVSVWNNRTLSADEHIGTGRIQLHKALSQGYDDAPWPLQSKTGRHTGEVRLIFHFINSKQQKPKVAPSAAYPRTPYPQIPPAGYPSQPCPPTGYPVQHYPPPPQPSSYYLNTGIELGVPGKAVRLSFWVRKN